jgi:hypothetical protein
MAERRNSDIKLEFRQDTINVRANISIKRRAAMFLTLLVIGILILLASSLNTEVRRLLLQILLGTLQTIVLKG